MFRALILGILFIACSSLAVAEEAQEKEKEVITIVINVDGQAKEVKIVIDQKKAVVVFDDSKTHHTRRRGK
jgi:hypothetical protein